jgi:hypothetical protein
LVSVLQATDYIGILENCLCRAEECPLLADTAEALFYD